MRSKRSAVAVTILLLSVAGAKADTLSGEDRFPAYSLRGYGTFGVSYADIENADFVRDFLQVNGAGHTQRWSTNVNSRLGAQLDARFDEHFSAFVQVLSQHRTDSSYQPEVEWASIKYQATPELSMRIGRTTAAHFMMSDTRAMGYTYPWVRPPQEIYDLIPVTHKDGIDATYKYEAGDITGALELSFGQIDQDVPNGGQLLGRNMFHAHSTAALGPATVHLNYSSMKGTFIFQDIDNFLDVFSEVGDLIASIPGQEATGEHILSIVDQSQVKDKPFEIYGVGLNYDDENWLLMTEWAKLNSSGMFSDYRAWFITTGYHFGKFTPYFTFADTRVNKPSAPMQISSTGLPLPLAQAANQLTSGLGEIIDAFAFKQKTLSAGVRWDVMRNVAVKVQYDHVDLAPGSTGRFANLQPGFQRGRSVNVFNFVVDFVF